MSDFNRSWIQPAEWAGCVSLALNRSRCSGFPGSGPDFLRVPGDGHLAELFPQNHQLGNHTLEFAHRPYLLAIERDEVRIGQPLGHGSFPLLAGEQRVGSPLVDRSIPASGHNILIDDCAAPDLIQSGKPPEEGPAPSMDRLGTGWPGFHFGWVRGGSDRCGRLGGGADGAGDSAFLAPDGGRPGIAIHNGISHTA